MNQNKIIFTWLQRSIVFLPSQFNRLFPKRVQRRFVRAWAAVLAENAGLYNGLYAGLVRVSTGKAKTPQKTLKEWYDRTRFKWEGGEITALCEKTLRPAIEKEDAADCARWAELLLKAAEAASIRREEAETLTLEDANAGAYTEWNGEELYVGDTVKIMHPAWYQEGRLVEQGICTLLEKGEE